MEAYFALITIIFFRVCELINSKKICSSDRGGLACCSNYRLENGKCVACSPGFYSLNCSKPCPDGHFGEFCVKQCRCSRLEICDIAYGCVNSSTDLIPTSLFQDEHLNATEQTTEKTTEQNDYDSRTELPALSLLMYPIFVVCVFLLCIVTSLVMYRNAKHTRRGVTQNRATPPEHNSQEVFPHEVINVIAEASGTDYAEIHECNPTYSSCAEASGVYNVLSFSKSRYRSETFNTVSGIYNTSKSCSTQKKETMSLEPQSDETDNAQLDSTELAADTLNHTADETNISQKQDE